MQEGGACLTPGNNHGVRYKLRANEVFAHERTAGTPVNSSSDSPLGFIVSRIQGFRVTNSNSSTA
eukprot:3847358-Pleurochrysis_carterae.AAC.2